MHDQQNIKICTKYLDLRLELGRLRLAANF